jgi:nitric oxide reductase NorQ protein
VAIDFTYPPPDVEAEIVVRESGVDPGLAIRLVSFAVKTRQMRGHGLSEGASTRMIVHAARLIVAGISASEALRACLVLPLTDDADMREALNAIISARAD